MKIRKLLSENHARVSALLTGVFPGSNCEVRLIEDLHNNKKMMHEWICIHKNLVAAYIAFTNAYEKKRVCGLHLAALVVKTELRNQGIGSELLRFALRQDEIKERTVFALGNLNFYKKFGFEPCKMPVCQYDKNNLHFLSLRNKTISQFTVGYDPEFKKNTGWNRSILGGSE